MKKLLVRLRASQDGSMAGFARRVVLAAFIVGVLIGALAAAYGGDSDELAQLAFVPSVERPSLAGAAATTLRYPLIAALCGFAVFGVVAEPLVVGVRGFLLAFTVTALCRMYGAGGFVLAAAVGAVQTLVALPCTVSLASQGFCGSASLLASLGGRAKGLRAYTSAYFLRMALIFVLLALGTLAEMYVTPWLAMFAVRLIT